MTHDELSGAPSGPGDGHPVLAGLVAFVAVVAVVAVVVVVGVMVGVGGVLVRVVPGMMQGRR